MSIKAAEAGRSSPLDNPLKRRGLLLGAGAAGAAAVAIKALPGATPLAPAAAVVEPVVDTAGGYQLTAHVQRYYDTTRA